MRRARACARGPVPPFAPIPNRRPCRRTTTPTHTQLDNATRFAIGKGYAHTHASAPARNVPARNAARTRAHVSYRFYEIGEKERILYKGIKKNRRKWYRNCFWFQENKSTKGNPLYKPQRIGTYIKQ